MLTLQAESQIDQLVEHAAHKCISVIMPTHEAGRQVKQNSIRFKNLVSQVVEQLAGQGETDSEAEKRVEPLRKLQRDDEFWQHQPAGMAVYLSGDQIITIGLHESPREVAMVSDSFYVTPVALDAAVRKLFRVLTLTWGEARVYVANRSEMKADQSDLFPVAIRDVVLPPDVEEHLQFRSQSTNAGGTMFHGQGEGEGTIETDRKRFLSEIGKRLERLSEQPSMPLIVVGTEEVQGEFVAATKIEPTRAIGASPDGLPDNELSKRVLQTVNDEHASADQLSEQLGTALANGKAKRDTNEIVEAATAGRVGQLWVNSEIFGKGNDNFDYQTLCLVNIAVIRTLQAGGEIVHCPAVVLESSPVAAMYRY